MRILFALTLALTGCAVMQKTAVNQSLFTYRADMQIGLGGTYYEGMAVTKLTGPITVSLRSPVALDRLQITSCARQNVYENVDPNIFGTSARGFTYEYTPVKAELDGLCPLTFEAFSKDQLTSWGFLAFRSDETLPAHADCNGAGYTFAGLTTCQTKNGLEQLLTFKVPVKSQAEKSCNLTQVDAQNFVFKPGKGFCRATFLSDDKQWHRVVMLGYDSVLVRVK